MSDLLGHIVIYRSRDGIDMPAIITGPAAEDGIHLELFPPPGAGKDVIDHNWGALHGSDRGMWREREQ